jgi:hypothetical protein
MEKVRAMYKAVQQTPEQMEWTATEMRTSTWTSTGGITADVNGAPDSREDLPTNAAVRTSQSSPPSKGAKKHWPSFSGKKTKSLSRSFFFIGLLRLLCT